MPARISDLPANFLSMKSNFMPGIRMPIQKTRIPGQVMKCWYRRPEFLARNVSDYAPDFVVSSLKTCNVNCRGPLRGEKGGELGVGGGQFVTNQE